MKARNAEDLLALVPIVLGFAPSDSVVMMTFGRSDCFHARIDLPQTSEVEELDAVAAALLDPASRHHVPTAAFVLYTEDAAQGRRVARRLLRAFTARGIDVIALLRSDGRRWYVAAGPTHGVPAHGVPYDVTHHPLRLQAVVDGMVTHASRTDLAATLAVDRVAVSRVEAVLADPSLLAEQGVLDPEAVAECCAAHVSGGTTFTDEELAAVGVAIVDLSRRDAAWAQMQRHDSTDHVRLWTDALRRTPEDLVGGVAAVLAFAAWLSGHGALAWCAVDRSERADPDNSLARLVGDLLSDAVPPASWSSLRADRIA